MVQRVLELYANLLDYPNEFFVQYLYGLEEGVRSLSHSQSVLEKVEGFIHAVEPFKIEEIQEMYIQTFELSPVCSPHVGFHLFGESYKRGSLMANLKQEYQVYGIRAGSEIPDHLSLMLKYASVLSGTEDEELFRELITLCLGPGLEKMAATFAETTNPYRYLLESLSTWLAEQGKKKEVNRHV